MAERSPDSGSSPLSPPSDSPSAVDSPTDVPTTDEPIDSKMLRTVSSEGAVPLRHPAPDLQSLQGAYLHNIERLEESAELLSMSGSDLGEEIQKLHLEQKLSDSRRASIRQQPAENGSQEPGLSSQTNSIVEVNTAARWGGYSPGGYIGSPIGSMRSSSWSHLSFPASSRNRNRSASKGSKLGEQIMVEDLLEIDVQGQPQLREVAANDPVSQNTGPNALRSQASFALEYEQISQDIRDGFQATGDPQPAPPDTTPRQEYEEGQLERPASAASGDTFQQSRILFEDFDGVHYAPSVRELPEQPVPVETVRHSSHLSSLPRPVSFAQPLPANGMVYYPAPVPRLLNLPQRLSQAPATTVQSKRRTQLVEQLHPDARKSAAWLNPRDGPHPTSEPAGPPRPADRQSMLRMSQLPPQLRASVFFDTTPAAHEIAIKDGSAAATLDSILEASAKAPVNAFTNHPIVGEIGGEVYKNEPKRKSAMPLLSVEKKDGLEKRKSRNILRRKSASSVDLLGMGVAAQNTSQNSLDKDEDARSIRSQPFTKHEMETAANAGQLGVEEPGVDPDELEESDDDVQGEPVYALPTTLLAELQMRKQQLKSRTRTAANAFPNGMHATLLELDAVAQIEKKKRKGQRVALAWEDPDAVLNGADDDNDDVPLGMLFAGRNGLLQKKNMGNMNDWDRPVGLLAMRELEESEPLSKRRNRLLGIRTPSPQKFGGRFGGPLGGPVEEPDETDEFEGETLAQRRRRLMDKEELDKALGDLSDRPVSTMFASEMMSTLGIDEAAKKMKTEEEAEAKRASATSPDANAEEAEVDLENETLGQRRARLQRAGATASTYNLQRNSTMPILNTPDPYPAPNQGGPQPALRNRLSMADLLAAAPAGKHDARRVSSYALLNALPPTSLLGQHEQMQATRKAELQERNRASMATYGYTNMDNSQVQRGAPRGGFMGGVFNDGTGGAGPNANLHRMSSMQQLPYAGTAGYPYQPMGMNPAMMHPQIGMGMPNGWSQSMPMLGMPMNRMGMPMGQAGFDYMAAMHDAPMDPRQRELIDRWRQSVAP